MKKFIAITLAVLLVLSAAPLTAFAANGPSPSPMAFISLFNLEDDTAPSYRVYGNSTVDNEAIAGATYDLASNTLTLTDFDHPELAMSTNMMGDDFKLKIVGDCSLSMMYVWGWMYGGSLDIQGDGTLTINEAKKNVQSILMPAEGSSAKLNFGKDVKVNLYGAENVATITYSGYTDTATAISFENGESYPFKSERIVQNVAESEPVLLYEKLDGTWWTHYGDRISCANDPDGLYAGRYYEDDDEYEVRKLIYLSDYDAYMYDPDFGDYGKYMSAEEFEEQGFSFVTERSEVKQLYSTEWLEEYSRGHEADLLTKDSDPDGVYVCNYSWRISRDDPDNYYISKLIWDEDIEFYVPDPDFDEDYDRYEFPETDYHYVLDEDDERETVRYLDDYTGIEYYGDRSPLLLNDNYPGRKFICETYRDWETDEISTYAIFELTYNEKRGYYIAGDESFERLTPDEFEASDYYYTYEDQHVECKLDHTGDVRLSDMDIYEDADGNRYGGQPYNEKVFDIDHDTTFEFSGRTYYLCTENTEVKLEDLTAIRHEVVTDFYSYTLEGEELHYNDGDAPEPGYMLGDVNGDGDILVDDATLVQKHAAGLETLTGAALKAADVNGDGEVNVADATQIQKYAAGLINKF